MNNKEARKIIEETNKDSAQNLFLRLAREQARSRNLIISFEGRYAQARAADPSRQSYTPFVIAQDEAELKL